MKYINSEGVFQCVTTEPTAGWIGEMGDNATPFIRIAVQVTDDGPEKGAGAVWNGWLSDKAFESTIKRLAEVFGFNGDLHSLTCGKTTLAGLPCSITTEFEEYDGKRKCKVKWLNAPGGGQTKPIDPRKLSDLLARVNKRAMLIAQAATGTKPEPEIELPTGGDEPEVPF